MASCVKEQKELRAVRRALKHGCEGLQRGPGTERARMNAYMN